LTYWLFSGSIGHPLFRKITAGSFSFKNQLTGIRYPDGSAYGFEYTAAGLLTAKIDPAGNRFEHFFDAAGRLESASDQEQGNWQFAQ